MKKFIAVIVSLILGLSVFGLMGCTKTDPDTVVIWWATGVKYKAPFDNALKKYKEANPEFKYEVKWQSDINYFSKYQANLFAGTDLPDVVVMAHTNVQSLAADGHLADLSAFGADAEKDKFLQPSWEANLYDDKAYGFPMDSNTQALIFNKDLFKGNGTLENPEIAYPTADWDYDDFLSACAALKAKNIVPFEYPSLNDASGFTTFTYTSWLVRNGGQILSDDLKTSQINSTQSKDVLNKIEDLKVKGYFNAGQWEEGSFYAGKIAMLEMGSWNIAQLLNEGQNFGAVPVVKMSDTVGSKSTLGLYSLAVSEKARNKQAAYDFIKFLSTDVEFCTQYSKNLAVFSSLKTALQDPYFSTGMMGVFKTALESAASRPGSPAWPKIESYIQKAIEAVMVDGTKHKTPDKALDDCHNQITKELQKYNS